MNEAFTIEININKINSVITKTVAIILPNLFYLNKN